MKEKEPLRKKVARQLASPLMAMGIGAASVAGGAADAEIYKHNIDNRLEQTLPLASPQELEEARKEILVFDNTVHDLIISGKSTIDIAEIADKSKLLQSIKLVDEQQMRERQRNELRNLASNSTRSAIDSSVILGGMVLALVGTFWGLGRLKEQRERRGVKISLPDLQMLKIH